VLQYQSLSPASIDTPTRARYPRRDRLETEFTLREYIIPNWHAILIHAPLGLLSVGLVLEILTLLWRHSSARAAARWMLLVGAIMAVPALTSGIYAYHDVIAPTTSPEDAFEERWDDLLDQTVKDRVPESVSADETKIREVPVRKVLAGPIGQELRTHIWRNSLGLAGVFLAVIIFIGATDLWRRRLYLPLLILLIASEGMIINGAHNGGLLVYQRGVATQPLPAGPPSEMKLTLEQTIKQYAPPAQVHFMMAGWVIGLALVALALSIRAVADDGTAAGPTPDEEWFETQQERVASPMPGSIATAYQTSADTSEGIVDRDVAPFGVAPAVEERREISRPLQPRGASPVTTVRTTTAFVGPVHPVPAARFWLLALLAGIVTFTAGLWLVNAWRWQTLTDIMRGENRNRYHVITGTTIIVCMLILSFAARFARRAKLVLVIFSVLLFGAVALQIYIGVLLTFDGPKGPSDKSAMKNLVAPLHWWAAPAKSAD
jgi:hypothetical protein